MTVLLVFDAVIGFWQQHTAADAVAALERQLAPRAAVRRGGEWRDVDAAELVPGRLLRLADRFAPTEGPPVDHGRSTARTSDPSS